MKVHFYIAVNLQQMPAKRYNTFVYKKTQNIIEDKNENRVTIREGSHINQ